MIFILQQEYWVRTPWFAQNQTEEELEPQYTGKKSLCFSPEPFFFLHPLCLHLAIVWSSSGILKLHDCLHLIPSEHAYQTTRESTKHLLLASGTEERALFPPTPGFTSSPKSGTVSLGLPAFFKLPLGPNTLDSPSLFINSHIVKCCFIPCPV